MNKLIITAISVYQLIVSPLLNQILGVQGKCRYPVTCSEFAKQSIEEYGILRGGVLALKRLLSCQPFQTVNI